MTHEFTFDSLNVERAAVQDLHAATVVKEELVRTFRKHGPTPAGVVAAHPSQERWSWPCRCCCP